MAVDLGAVRERLRAAGEPDRADWERVRAVLLDAVDESTFEIWLAPLELIAVDVEGALVVSAPPEMVSWLGRRFGRIFDNAAARAGRRLRVGDELERKAAVSLTPIATAVPDDVSAHECAERSGGFVADASSGGSGDPPVEGSTYPCSYTDVYTQFKEVS